jgi:DNA (cytosine-5)-methyltransferase 1
MISEITGFKIKELRLNKGISQAKLAVLSGIDQAKISAWELGKDKIERKNFYQLFQVIQTIDDSQVAQLKKKRYQKKDSSSFSVPKRGYVKTSRNEEYLDLLGRIEANFLNPNYKSKALSFFAGCGGLCYGAKAAGIEIVGTNELVEEYKDVYRKNFPEAFFLPNDIRDIKREHIEELLNKHGSIDVMLGGPPCQGFSLAGKRDVQDKRNTLFEDYLKISKYLQPKVILIENVRLLTSMKDPDGTLVKDRVIDTFDKLGYNSRFFIANAKNYGVPQHRERIIFIGIRKDIKAKLTIPEELFSDEEISLFNNKPMPFTFGDAVSDLSFLESGQKDLNDPYHWAVKHPAHVLNWLVDVPQGKSAHDNENPNLRPPSGYNTTYKRQVWNEPGGTVATTFGMISGCRNVHPIATRSMTIREAMRLQSFPDSFELTGTSGAIRTVIGNAVPPLLSYFLSKHIIENYI